MSNQSSNRVRVDIFGQEYHLRGEESPEYLNELAHNVDDKMKEIAKSYPRLDTQRVAVLAAVTFLDQWMRLRKEYEELLKALEAETEK